MENVRRREIWTRLAVDPIALPVGRRVARLPAVTPNRVTALAGCCAVAAAVCFATGTHRVGGVLFLLRFVFDVMDGVVAREQGASSARGAALDGAVDVAGISLCYAALAWDLVRTDRMPAAVAFLLLAVVVFYNWVLAYRKGLASDLDLGDGGAFGRFRTDLPLGRQWVSWCARLNMSPVPWAVEAETVALGLGPLVLPARFVWLGLAVALGFYLVADMINVRRVLRLADTAQRRQELQP